MAAGLEANTVEVTVTVAQGVASMMLACAIAGLGACATSSGPPPVGDTSGPSSGPAGGAVATFEVAGGERYHIELVDPAVVEHARRLLAGEKISAIPLGTVVRRDSGPNAPWTWHIDPATFSFAFATIEVCDGIPSDVEKGVVTSNEYCPWSAKVVAVEPSP